MNTDQNTEQDTETVSLEDLVAYANECNPNELNEIAEEAHSDKKDDKKKQPPMDLDIKKGGFHRWLGKNSDYKITDKDIEKGLKSDDPHVRRMAQFAKNAKKWKHKKKVGRPSDTNRRKAAVEQWADTKLN